MLINILLIGLCIAVGWIICGMITIFGVTIAEGPMGLDSKQKTMALGPLGILFMSAIYGGPLVLFIIRHPCRIASLLGERVYNWRMKRVL